MGRKFVSILELSALLKGTFAISLRLRYGQLNYIQKFLCKIKHTHIFPALHNFQLTPFNPQGRKLSLLRIWIKLLLEQKTRKLELSQRIFKIASISAHIHTLISPYWVTYNAAMTAIKTRRDVDLLLQQPEKQAIPHSPWIETLSLTILFHLCRHFICCKRDSFSLRSAHHTPFHIFLYMCKHGAFKAAICQHFFFHWHYKNFLLCTFFILNNSFFPQLYFFFCFKSVGDGGSAKKK